MPKSKDHVRCRCGEVSTSIQCDLHDKRLYFQTECVGCRARGPSVFRSHYCSEKGAEEAARRAWEQFLGSGGCEDGADETLVHTAHRTNRADVDRSRDRPVESPACSCGSLNQIMIETPTTIEIECKNCGNVISPMPSGFGCFRQGAITAAWDAWARRIANEANKKSLNDFAPYPDRSAFFFQACRPPQSCVEFGSAGEPEDKPADCDEALRQLRCLDAKHPLTALPNLLCTLLKKPSQIVKLNRQRFQRVDIHLVLYELLTKTLGHIEDGSGQPPEHAAHQIDWTIPRWRQAVDNWFHSNDEDASEALGDAMKRACRDRAVDTSEAPNASEPPQIDVSAPQVEKAMSEIYSIGRRLDRAGKTDDGDQVRWIANFLNRVAMERDTWHRLYRKKCLSLTEKSASPPTANTSKASIEAALTTLRAGAAFDINPRCFDLSMLALTLETLDEERNSWKRIARKKCDVVALHFAKGAPNCAETKEELDLWRSEFGPTLDAAVEPGSYHKITPGRHAIEFAMAVADRLRRLKELYERNKK